MEKKRKTKKTTREQSANYNNDFVKWAFALTN
jgi:hypothetical protein